jgi:hypothetical protein
MIGQIARCDACGASNDVDGDVCWMCRQPMAGPDACAPGRVALHPAVRFRFADVLNELGAIASMAGGGGSVEGAAVAAACRRAESLLMLLRRQFLDDVVHSAEAPHARHTA